MNERMIKGQTVGRIESVDLFRFAAISAVIVLHTDTHGKASFANADFWMYFSVFVDQLARFAVPFFFVISGYFWGLKVRKEGTPIPASLSMGKRILAIFIAWSFIYLFPIDHNFAGESALGLVKAAYWNAREQANDPLTLVMQGTKVHLWFLVGLLCSISISTLLVKYGRVRLLVAFAVVLYVTGLMAKAYSGTPLGLHMDFNTRNGPFFGTIFFVSGYLLSNFRPDERWFGWGMLILGFGYVLHFSEIYFLWRYYGASPYQDYVVGTYFIGIGAALASLSNHPFLRLAILSSLGRMTLGIYAIHFVFVDLLKQSFKAWNLPWGFYFLAVLVLSVASAMMLSKNRFTRKLVI